MKEVAIAVERVLAVGPALLLEVGMPLDWFLKRL